MEPNEFVEQELKLIQQLFEKAKQVIPMFVLIKNDDRATVPAYFGNDIQKYNTNTAIKAIVAKTEPDIVIFMAEAWTVDAKEIPVQRPLENPDRREIVIVHIEFRTGEKFANDADIIGSGQERRMGKFRKLDPYRSVGLFMDFFPITRTN